MTDFTALAHFLFQCANSRVPAHAHDQLEALAQGMRLHQKGRGFQESFATATRRFGSATISLTTIETGELARLGVIWPPIHRLDELVRIAMLTIAAADLTEPAYRVLIQDCYEHGDVRERRAILRALPFLPHGDRFLALALEACRSHVLPIFEAIACENRYPAEHLPGQNFNQMVLRALFTETAISRIVGLEKRITPELMQMARDYASERQAAGRSIPPDVRRLAHGE
ncbi:MAG TPA: EboA domain-containing protein [Nitrospiraceae bacterium]|nr:EboA domain-containing protein [Nitrospiraceae bacterium]